MDMQAEVSSLFPDPRSSPSPRGDRTRRGFRAGALCLLAGLLASCAGGHPAGDLNATPALWQVDSPRGNSLWLFGTVHELPGARHGGIDQQSLGSRRLRDRPPALSWYHGPLQAALNRSRVLVVETLDVVERGQLLAMARRLEEGSDCATPPEAMDAELAEELSRFMQPREWPGELPRSAPAQLFLLHNLDRQPAPNGYLGVEYWLMREAARQGMLVDALETLADRMAALDRAFSRADCETQQQAVADFFELVTRRSPETRMLLVADSQRLWAAGRTAELAAEMERFARLESHFFEAFIGERNRAWIPAIVELLESGRNAVVAVGLAHLAGPDSVVDLLEDRGYRVKRIQ